MRPRREPRPAIASPSRLRGAAEMLADQVRVAGGLDGGGAGLLDRGASSRPEGTRRRIDRHGPIVPDAGATRRPGAPSRRVRHDGGVHTSRRPPGATARWREPPAGAGATRPDGHHAGRRPAAADPADGRRRADTATADGPAGRAPRKLTVTRVAVARTRELTAQAVRRVRTASRADGAGESGLTQLLWVNALHMAGDAMIAVSLAGTLFFAAATDAQRGNVALYLRSPWPRSPSGRPRDRPGAGPAAARPPVGARGQPRRPRRPRRW